MRLIVTDLDGTLIDHHTYAADAAAPALAAAAAARVPVVPCSSKTRGEMQALVRDLALPPAPLIAENGSVVWFPPTWSARAVPAAVPDREGGWLAVLGWPSEALRPVLATVAGTVGRRLLPLSAMSLEEVVARTGLAPAAAALACAREYSEPFVIDGEPLDLATLDAAARPHGTRVTRGGRFFHLLGPTDKGAAVRVVRATCPPGHRALGLGDAPNDLALLQAVDEAVIIPQPSHGIHPELADALPGAGHAAATGPAGWNEAVLVWLDRTDDTASGALSYPV